MGRDHAGALSEQAIEFFGDRFSLSTRRFERNQIQGIMFCSCCNDNSCLSDSRCVLKQDIRLIAHGNKLHHRVIIFLERPYKFFNGIFVFAGWICSVGKNGITTDASQLVDQFFGLVESYEGFGFVADFACFVNSTSCAIIQATYSRL